jgi:single-strand DNA-binding protein
MSDTITITGLIATTPRHVVTSEGLPITSFRLASSQRRFDKATATWVDASTNWYTVTAFRQLAINAVPSLSKGDRIVVSGRLRVRDWQTDDRTGTNVEIEAETLGHDLFWGTAVFTRLVALGSDSQATAAEPETAPEPVAAV